MEKNIIKNKGEERSECRLCKADFDIWAETIDLSPEREERMRRHFSHVCAICKCLLACKTINKII